MINFKNCPICDSGHIKYLFTSKDRLYSFPGEFKLFICLECKLIFQNPQLSIKEASFYYPNDYIAYNLRKDKRNKMIQLLYNVYYSNNEHKILKILFYPVKNLLRSMPKKDGAKFLDIGCGNGRFLELVKKNSMEPHGIDPFIKESIKGLNIKKMNLFQVKYPNNYFDYISLNNVLEHVQAPIIILRECNRILKKEGTIFVNVPNKTSLNYGLFYDKWVSIEQPRHLFLFSKKSLRISGRKAGLKIKKIIYKSEPFTILGSLEYLYNKIKIREKRLDESKFISNPLFNLATIPFSLFFNALRIGDQIEIVYIKQHSNVF